MNIKNSYEFQMSSKELEKLKEELKEHIELIKILRDYISVENKKGLNIFDRRMNRIVEIVNKYFTIITNNSSRIEHKLDSCLSLIAMLGNDKYADYIKSTLKATDMFGKEAAKLRGRLEPLQKDNKGLTILDGKDALFDISKDPKKAFKSEVSRISVIIQKIIETEKDITEYIDAYNAKMARKKNNNNNSEEQEKQIVIDSKEETKEEIIPNAEPKQDDKKEEIEKKKEDKNEFKVEKSIFTSQEIDEEERKRYEKYKIIRAELDDIFENKKSFKDEDAFEQEVVSRLKNYNLGTSYEEIIQNISEIRKSLKVTQDIEKIIMWVESDYIDNPEDMYKIEKNGLSRLENNIHGRLLVVQTHGKISPELREEISYYTHQLYKTEVELDRLKKGNYSNEEEYQYLKNETKVKHLVNTLLIDENKLINKNSKTR